ncbi:hypothetical protein [Nocardioides nitrophenolicus]|uniref:hypothetical protein n=1 Tax=Nocardioides nitrophenolicus TaxID=60489 RepID=UPI0019568243|nr:hypothetical protein [Nocardioides nitrophenolicus]MBM7519530.1 hypothetical protein [Nocardioides nitrophenolicus]
MSELAARLRADLATAMKARDLPRVKVLRTMTAVVANAEAVPVTESSRTTSAGPIAGAAMGLGAAEAARRELTDDDVRTLVAGERDERLAAAGQVEAQAPERAAELRAAAELLAAYL